MRTFWETAERLDRAAIFLLDKVRKVRKQESFRESAEQAVEHVRPAQRAIQFDA